MRDSRPDCLFCLGREAISMKPPGTRPRPGRPDGITNASGVYEMRAELPVHTRSSERETALWRTNRTNRA